MGANPYSTRPCHELERLDSYRDGSANKLVGQRIHTPGRIGVRSVFAGTGDPHPLDICCYEASVNLKRRHDLSSFGIDMHYSCWTVLCDPDSIFRNSKTPGIEIHLNWL